MLIAKYTCNASGVVPTFNNGYVYEVNETEDNGIYTVEITSDTDFSSCSFNGKNQLLTVEYLKVTSKVTSTFNMFNGCTNLTSLNLSNWNTSNVNAMNSMFYDCSKLTSLDLSHFDTSNVENIRYMFYNCSKLTSLDLSNFDTSNVTTLSYMFYGCSKLTSLDLSNFDTSNVIAMINTFNGCTNLTSLDLSNFNTSKVTSMESMFQNCTNLTSLDVSSFNTSNVTDMTYMFRECNNLTSLDLSSFNTSNVANMGNMFLNCNNLTSLGLIYADIVTLNQLPTPTTATLYIDPSIDQTAYTGSSKLEVYEQRTVTINIPTALRSNGEIADRIYWNDEDKHYYIEQNINPNTNETLETPNIIASGVKQPIYLTVYENMLSVGIQNIDASYMSINVPFFEIPTDYEYNWEDELDYIKQSFELRYPDEEDVPNGWGFMGINKETYVITVPRLGANDAYVCGIPTEYFGTSLTNNTGLNLTFFRFHDASGGEILMTTLASGTTLNVPENAVTFTFCDASKQKSYTFNEHTVITEGRTPIDETWSDMPYSGHQVTTNIVEGEYEDGTGLKTLIDWVDNCKDEEFVRDFDQHFNRDYTLRYFLLVITLG